MHVVNARLCVHEVNRGRLGSSECGGGFIVAVGLLALRKASAPHSPTPLSCLLAKVL